MRLSGAQALKGKPQGRPKGGWKSELQTWWGHPGRPGSGLTLTKYMVGDGTGIVNSGGEGGAGSDGPDSSLAAGAVGAEGAVSILGVEIAGVCPEAGGEVDFPL